MSTLAVSTSWAAAVESEATALQLALTLLQHSRHVSAGHTFLSAADLTAVLAVEDLQWFQAADLDAALAAPQEVAPAAFATQIGLEALSSLSSMADA